MTQGWMGLSAFTPSIPPNRAPPICALQKHTASISLETAIFTGKPSATIPLLLPFLSTSTDWEPSKRHSVYTVYPISW